MSDSNILWLRVLMVVQVVALGLVLMVFLSIFWPGDAQSGSGVTWLPDEPAATAAGAGDPEPVKSAPRRQASR